MYKYFTFDSMFRYLTILMVASLFFITCKTPQPVTEIPLAEQYTPQEKAELSVKSYLKKTFDSLGTYQPYGFGKVTEIIPDEVVQLQELKEMRRLAPDMKDHYPNKMDSIIAAYDTLIAQKEREIKTKKIRSFYKISHLFLSQMKGDSIRAQESEFTLDPNFKMYDVHTSMFAGLSEEEGKWFDFYYNQYPLLTSWENSENEGRNAKIYAFYDKKLEQTAKGKENVLKQILFIISHIKTAGEFSNQKVAEAVVKKGMLKNEGATYQSVKFSTLKAIVKKSPDGTQELIGYSMVNLYKTTSAENLIVEKAMYFEFDPWLILAGYLPVTPPYEPYFEN